MGGIWSPQWVVDTLEDEQLDNTALLRHFVSSKYKVNLCGPRELHRLRQENSACHILAFLHLAIQTTRERRRLNTACPQVAFPASGSRVAMTLRGLEPPLDHLVKGDLPASTGKAGELVKDSCDW